MTAASKLGGPIAAFVAGSGSKKVAEDARKVSGLERVIVVENGAYDKVGGTRYLLYALLLRIQGLPENFAPLLAENIKSGGYTHVIASHSAFGKNLMPRVAALLDSQQISEVITIESEDSGFN